MAHLTKLSASHYGFVQISIKKWGRTSNAPNTKTQKLTLFYTTHRKGELLSIVTRPVPTTATQEIEVSVRRTTTYLRTPVIVRIAIATVRATTLTRTVTTSVRGAVTTVAAHIHCCST